MNTSEHLLTCLAEECGEVIQAVGKSLRFGLCDQPPSGLPKNYQYLACELNDVIAIVEMLNEHEVVEIRYDREAIEQKKAKVRRYMEYAKQRGTLTGDHP